MLTESGIGLAAGIALSFVAIACFVVMVMQYRQKGPVISATYFAANAKEQKAMRTKKAYHYAGNVFLYLTLISCLFGLSFIFDNMMLASAGATLSAAGALSGIIFVATYK